MSVMRAGVYASIGCVQAPQYVWPMRFAIASQVALVRVKHGSMSNCNNYDSVEGRPAL